MAAPGPTTPRRRPRRGSLERPVSGRVYRGTWLLVALPLLVAAFSVARPAPLPAPTLPPTFDEANAHDLATQLATRFPDRRPGTRGGDEAANWVAGELGRYGLPVTTTRFDATIPGIGRRTLRNVSAVVGGRAGQSPQTIVVLAHRDDTGAGPGANDNASGTAALIELARSYAAAPGSGGRAPATASHRLLFLSTDGGDFGGLGALHFVEQSPFRRDVVGVIDLDSIGGAGRPRLEIAGDAPRSPAASLVRTAAQRLADESGGVLPRRPSGLGQLVDLAFPFSLYEQAPFVGRGIPAVTITTAGTQPPDAFADTPGRLDARRLGRVGRAAQDLLGSLDQGLELAQGTTSYVWLGDRMVRGWAVELVLVSALLPFLVAVVDLFARCRRRRLPLAPAFRAFRSRLAFWLFAGALFELFALAGVWPRGAARPLSPATAAATTWPVVGLAGLATILALAWLVARHRLLPRRPVAPAEQLAGHTAALLALGVVALVVVAVNPFALVFVLPSLHVWLWLPQWRGRVWSQALLLAAGLAGPGLLLWSLGSRYGLGWDAPWYLAALVSVGYVGLGPLVVALAWAAAGAQLAALAAGRYAPYPDARERGPRGPLRETVRTVVLGIRRRRRVTAERRRAFAG